MNIKIGDKNKIKKSHIGHKFNQRSNVDKEKSFAARHPVLISMIITLVGGFIYLFSFWESVIAKIESVFK